MAARSRQAPRKTPPSTVKQPHGHERFPQRKWRWVWHLCHKGITFDGATVTVRASAGNDEASALFTDEDDIVIKNGSIVDAFAEGQFSTAIFTRNYYPNEAGGHIYISDSVVKAIARYVESGSDGPDHYSNDQSGAVIPEHGGMNIGIFARTRRASRPRPSRLSAVRSQLRETRRQSSPLP
ncbi:MAG: hypothetical protein ACLU0O_06475 [Collinsella sp.]